MQIVSLGLPGDYHPATNLTVCAGQSATFTVTATGTAPLSYQWYTNGIPLSNGGNISGATGPNLTIGDVQLAQSGSLSVVVANLCGSVRSLVVTLTVVAPAPPTVECVADKTVPCGAPWGFDQPSAYSTCCSNVPAQLISSNQVPGLCPPVWQGVWQAVDCYSNTATCTQTVTVVDTNLPVIQCPSSLVFYSCTNVPVFYPVTASDLCYPNLPVACTPTNGSSFAPGTTTPVCCVATNCSGHSATNCFTVTVQWATNCCGVCLSNLLVNGNFEEEPDWGSAIWISWFDNYAKSLIGNELPGWTIETNHAVTIHRTGGADLTIINEGGVYSLNTDGEGYDGTMPTSIRTSTTLPTSVIR